MTPRRRVLVLLSVLALVGLLPIPAHAGAFEWQGPAEGQTIRVGTDIYGSRDPTDTITVSAGGIVHTISPNPREDWWGFRWDCFDQPEGPSMITVRRYADGVLTDEITRTVIVQNVPSFSFASPRIESFLSGPVAVSGRAKLADGVDLVEVSMRRELRSGAVVSYPVTVTSAERWSGTWDTDLVPEGTYSFYGRASNAAGEEASGGDAPIFVDRTAPTIQLDRPAAGASVSGTLTVTGSAFDATWLEHVDAQIGALEPAGGTATFSRTDSGDTLMFEKTFDTTALPDGAHDLRVTAYDVSGRTTRLDLPIVVDNSGPTIGFDTPSGSNLEGLTTIGGSLSEPVGSVTWSVDGGPLHSGQSDDDRWSATVDSDDWTDGWHSIVVRATDAFGNQATVTRSRYFRNATTLSLDTPAASQTVSGTTRLAGTASDQQGVTSITIAIDGGAAVDATYAAGAWSLDVDTIPLGDGSHSVTMRATDGEARVTSAAGAFSVDNAPYVVIDRLPSAARGRIVLRGDVVSPRGVASVRLRAGSQEADAVIDGSRWSGEIDTVPLGDGWRSFRVTARDVSGGERWIESGTVVDNTAPSWSDPPRQITDGVTITAWDAHGVGSLRARIGETTAVSAAGAASVTLDTSHLDGEFLLEVSGGDALGNEITRWHLVEIDNRAPSIGFDTSDAPWQPSDVVVRGSIYDSGVIVEATVSVDGGEPTVLEIDEDNGMFTLALDDLSSGEHEVAVRATDSVGQVGSATHRFAVDADAPYLRIVKPLEGSITANDIAVDLVSFPATIVVGPGPGSLVVDASDDRSGLGWLTYCVDEATSTQLCDRSRNLSSSVLAWAGPGEHDVSVTAEDVLGNTRRREFHVLKI